MRKESHKYDITQCALYKKKSSKQLKKILYITEEESMKIYYLSFIIIVFKLTKRIVQRREILQLWIKKLRKYKPEY